MEWGAKELLRVFQPRDRLETWKIGVFQNCEVEAVKRLNKSKHWIYSSRNRGYTPIYTL
jgi:hypothetical protein